MNKEKYLEARKALMDEAQQLLDAGKLDEFNAKTKEIEALDAQFEAAGKAQANLNALRDNARVTSLENSAVNVTGGKVTETLNMAGNENEDITNSIEYRKAFMNHVVKGEAMPAKFRNADANTLTTDVGVMIPTTVMEKIIEKMESYGMILPLITRTSYKGGVKIPTSTVKPTATWVSEGSGSDKQKKTTDYISFGYYKLRCAVSVSLETDTMALAIFETTLINNVVEAMTKKLEGTILSAAPGTASPKGIFAETPPAGQALKIAEGTPLSYSTLVDMEAALPQAYEGEAVWLMTKKTFMSFVGMVDDNKQPIARVNYGINGKPERVLLGRPVICNTYMSSYASSVEADTLIAALFNLKDYILNTNLNMTIKRYEDNETDDQVTKSIMLADGKVVDNNSLVTLTIEAA